MSRHSVPREWDIKRWAIIVFGVLTATALGVVLALASQPVGRPADPDPVGTRTDPTPAPTVTVTESVEVPRKVPGPTVTKTVKIKPDTKVVPGPTVTRTESRTATPKEVPPSAAKNAPKVRPTAPAPTTAAASASVDAPAAATTTPPPRAKPAPTRPVPTLPPVAPPTAVTAEPDVQCVPGKRGNMTLTIVDGVEHYGSPNSC